MDWLVTSYVKRYSWQLSVTVIQYYDYYPLKCMSRFLSGKQLYRLGIVLIIFLRNFMRSEKVNFSPPPPPTSASRDYFSFSISKPPLLPWMLA